MYGVIRVTMAVFVALVAAGAGAQEKSSAVMGNWEGKFTTPGWEGRVVSAQIVAEFSDKEGAKDAYRAVVSYGPAKDKLVKVVLTGSTDGAKTTLAGEVDLGGADGKCHAIAEVTGDTLKGAFQLAKPAAFELKKVEKKSPTMGAPAPKGAIVLFDGSNEDAWTRIPEKWPVVDGAFQVTGSQFATKQEFGSFKLHLEFRCPYMPSKFGQARGNSGVYILGRYEVQVLDSFGLEPKDNECGGIYHEAAPKVNASFPPATWQTYDITFHAAKIGADGKKTKDAEISVEQNGVVIHDHLKLSGPTPGGLGDKDVATGPLMLQDHGNPVRYRNIWIQPLQD